MNQASKQQKYIPITLRYEVEGNQYKPIQVQLALENTFVFTHCQNERYQLVHMSITGKKLWRKGVTSSVKQFFMPDSRIVLFVDLKENSLDIFNLEAREKKSISLGFAHKKENKKVDFQGVYFFSQTKLLLFVIKTEENLQIFYININKLHEIKAQISGDVVLWNEFQIKKSERKQKYTKQTNKLEVCKINDYSKIHCKINNNYFIYIQDHFTIEVDCEEKIVKKPMNISLNLFLDKLSSSNICWQVAEHTYLIEPTFKIYSIDNSNQIKSQNSPQNSHNLKYCDKNIEVHNDSDGFKILKHKNFVVIAKLYNKMFYGNMLYFIDCSQKTVVSILEWIDGMPTHVWKTDWNDENIVSTSYCEGQNMSVKLIHLASLSDILLHFLLFINEDFDDDLLYDAIKLLS